MNHFMSWTKFKVKKCTGQIWAFLNFGFSIFTDLTQVIWTLMDPLMYFGTEMDLPMSIGSFLNPYAGPEEGRKI